MNKIPFIYWFLDKFINFIEITFILIFLLFEELLWNTIGIPVRDYIESLTLTQRFMVYVKERINRWLLLFLFLLPLVLMEAFALLSGRMFLAGNIIWGILAYVMKGVLMIPVVFIFSIGKEKLLSFSIITFGYNAILWLKATVIYQRVTGKLASIKKDMKAFFRRLKLQFPRSRSYLQVKIRRYYKVLKRRVSALKRRGKIKNTPIAKRSTERNKAINNEAGRDE